MNGIGKRAHVLKHSHGRCVIVALNKNFINSLFGTVIELFYLLSSTNQYFFTLCIMVQYFMKNVYHHKYIHVYIYIDDDGSGVFPKQNVRKIHNSKYQLTNSNRYYVIKNDHIKDTRIRQTYSRIKQRETGYVYITGSPYRDAEGLSQLR